MCTGCEVAKGRSAPMQSRPPREQPLAENAYLEDMFFSFCPMEPAFLRLHFEATTFSKVWHRNGKLLLQTQDAPERDSGRAQESLGRVWLRSVRALRGPIFR